MLKDNDIKIDRIKRINVKNVNSFKKYTETVFKKIDKQNLLIVEDI
jgi:hypothetical protein